MTELNYLEKAIGCCGLSAEGLAKLWGVSFPTAKSRINNPGSMTINQFRALYVELDEYARCILDDYIDDVRRK